MAQPQVRDGASGARVADELRAAILHGAYPPGTRLRQEELAAQYGVSRKTAYKWLERYERGGAAGVSDRSRRPHHSPHATAAALMDAIVALRRKHPRWGAKKLLRILRRRDPASVWPARSTACDYLKARGLVPSGRRQPRMPARSRGVALSKRCRPSLVATVWFSSQPRFGS